MGHRYHDLVNDDAFLPSWTVEDVYADVENEYFDPARQKFAWSVPTFVFWHSYDLGTQLSS